MKSPADIRNDSDMAARKAAQEGLTPFVFWDKQEIDCCPPFPFPQLGDHKPKGWREIPELEMFCDSSGFGQEGEPALTVEQFISRLHELVDENCCRGFGIGDVGQFQLYVKVYEKENVV